MNKIYREGNWSAKVKIVEDCSTENFEQYTLEVVEELSESVIGLDVGHQFTVSWTKDPKYEGNKIWDLEDE